MVKLDATLLRYLSRDDFKVLTSVEMGMKNHELVPGLLINSIASLRYGGCGKILVELTKNKLLAYERGKRYDGYRLTYAGYDFLALNAFTQRESIIGVGNQIGVGKESDVYICQSPNHDNYVIKLHRLGRVCFRKVAEKRDFYTKTRNKTSWIYLSRRAAQREFQFLSYMYHEGLPVPKPIDSNRHVVVMEMIEGQLLNHFTLDSFDIETRECCIAELYKNLMSILMKFANQTRVVHGDFNEFNIIIKKDEQTNKLNPVIIDLPQMINVDHDLACDYFERDVECIVDFFVKRFHYESDYVPKWSDVSDLGTEKKYPDRLSLFLKDTQDAITENDLDELETEISQNKPLNDIFSKPPVILNHETKLSTNSRLASEEFKSSSIDETVPSPHMSVSQEKTKPESVFDECISQLTVCTIDPIEAKRRIKLEMMRQEANRKKYNASKTKNIKGDANPVRRRRKTNQQVACEDAAAFSEVF